MFRSGSWGISVLMAVFPGSLLYTNTGGATCFGCKQGVETVNHFLLECPGFKENLDSLWDKLKTKARHLNPVDRDQMGDFITNLDHHNKMLLLLVGSPVTVRRSNSKLYQKISCCRCWKDLQDLHGKVA